MHKTLFAAMTTLVLATGCMGAPDDHAADQDLAEIANPLSGPGFIDSVSYTGTGCPKGTATTGISLDKQAVTSLFSRYVTLVNPAGGTVTRNCLAMMKINVPRGWSYTLDSVDYRGFADLRRGMTASRHSVYVLSGGPTHATPAARISGEISDDYTQNDVGPRAPAPWSGCGTGQNLWIATQTDVAGRGAGQFTIDTIDTVLRWRRCK